MRADTAGAMVRVQLMRIIERAESIREGCRLAGVHPSTYYRWRKRIEVAGGDPVAAFVPSDVRRRPGPQRSRLEAMVIAAALAYPSKGPRMLRHEVAKLAPEVGSASQVWRILSAHGLSTGRARYRLMAYARGIDHPIGEPDRSWRRDRSHHLDADVPGDLIQIDCFHIGRVKEARLGPDKKPGHVWQYTAIDVASSFVWSTVAVTAHNPSAVHTTALAFEVAKTLAVHEWQAKAVTTDRGNEFRHADFTTAVDQLGIEHRYVTRPQTNGKVEQMHNTFLRELWAPHFARYEPRGVTALQEALTDYLWYYNYERPHHGRWNKGTPPAQILIPNRNNQP